jgi:four helix bundle protein
MKQPRSFPQKNDSISHRKHAVLANSIVLNIAEGSGRGTKKDFSHFLDMALGSTFETVACFFVARRQSYVSQHDLEEMKRDGESLSRRINAFKRTLK